ncbi:hypothetical protein TCAL_06749 [Tigriopus californicus]|uniref:Homeobox domain-containing protein n=1 Tax=Tigriopus californicus TaxID=6832 RepID=A0A553PKN1_TIGCA|nr:homeobox protein HB3-like [Tigriopus californicus]TRY78242.1 hypothetical protein TCAL_06749 [Tigriopus californicus]|eukprot:TCALIF_06749-PA protein Name:"Similar to bsh Brain-specific homeobox protein (Drosophila melanogaster)" AED:0.08 eAED:0.08 QI:0/0/0.5/1/1/1/2/192/173
MDPIPREDEWSRNGSTSNSSQTSRSIPQNSTLSDEQRLLQTYLPSSSIPHGSLYPCQFEDRLQLHYRTHSSMHYGYPQFVPMVVPDSWKGLCSTSLRSRYTEHQTNCLKEVYAVKKYVNTDEMIELSCKTGLSRHQVKTWFQNRRLKDRKVSKANNITAESSQEPTRRLPVDE